MQLLLNFKYSYNRQQAVSFILISFFEICYIAQLVSNMFSPFYADVLQMITFKGQASMKFSLAIYVFNLIVLLIVMSGILSNKQSIIKTRLWPIVGASLKLIPFTLFIVVVNHQMINFTSNPQLVSKICCSFNILMFVLYNFVHEFINQTLKFKQNDFCNKRMISYPQVILIISSIISIHIGDSLYSSVIYLFRSVYVIIKLYNNYQFKFSQRLQLFYALLYGYFALSVLIIKFGLVKKQVFLPLENTSFIILGGVFVSWIFSKKLSLHIYSMFLEKTQWGIDLVQGDNATQDHGKILQMFENQLKILVEVILEKQKKQNNQPNDYDYFWKTFNERVFIHKLKCAETHCTCKKSGGNLSAEHQQKLFINDLITKVQNVQKILIKEHRLKIIHINLLIEIAKKPLKGYFELISIKSDKMDYNLKLQIEDLISKSRECFDQIYHMNKVQNQQLSLMKIIQCQQVMTSLEEDILAALSQTAIFLQLFTYNTAKINQVQLQSQKLFKLKEVIQAKLQKVVMQIGQNKMVEIAIFIFYRMLQVYKSKQMQLKKFCSQQDLKKRLLQKAEGQIISEENGVIYIDLVQERGKIKKITKNISTFFGFSKQDMVGFNINLFMPTLFGKFHAKFLSNFIDKGRIKLLKEKARIVFGKNKEKFIFPISIKLKTEHLHRNEFGASALIGKIDTNSEFIIAGNFGRIEEITSNFYKRVFGKTLKEQINKINRFCIYKMILGLNQIIYNWQQKHANKVHEGLLIFPKTSQYFFQKFRYSRDNSYSQNYNHSISRTFSASQQTAKENLPNELNLKIEKQTYFTDLFQIFFSTLNLNLLRAIKINFKYSRLKTAEFEVQIIQILSVRQQLEGQDCFRAILNEIYNVTNTYDLNQQNSALSHHLEDLQNQILNKMESFKGTQKKMSNSQLPAQNQSQNERSAVNQYQQLQISDHVEEQEQKLLVNKNNSQQSSVIGNSQNQSKKQLLINAFNSNQNKFSAFSLEMAYTILTFLITILILMVYLCYNHYQTMNNHWSECFFILKLRSNLQFRQSMVELDIFTAHQKITLNTQLISQKAVLNQELSELIQAINKQTVSKTQTESLFATRISLYDPIKKINYQQSFLQIISQLSWMYTNNSDSQTEFLKHNYQKLHNHFRQFYKTRQQELFDNDQKSLSLIQLSFVVFQSLLAIVTLSAVPLYFYFKKQEVSIKNKLAYMNSKQIKKRMGQLKTIQTFLKEQKNKRNLHYLQGQLSAKNQQRDDDEGLNSNRSIKITSDSDQMKLFKGPLLYILVIGFILIFSNLSITIYSTTKSNSSIFTQLVKAKQLVSNLQTKTPVLLNVYLSNINRVLNNKPLTNYSALLLKETNQGYFDLLGQLSQKQYDDNRMAKDLEKMVTSRICQGPNCNNSMLNGSLNFIANSFKNRFDYWRPENNINMDDLSIRNWVKNNNITTFLNQIYNIMILSKDMNSKVETEFTSFIDSNHLMAVVLGSILIPINALGLIIILEYFLKILDNIIKNAQAIFMHFPVSILVENTYLTSYFNSKLKQGK